jgi:hypothetical protein
MKILEVLEFLALSYRVMDILLNFRSYATYFQHNEMMQFSAEVLPVGRLYNK